jgi:hypothetical protein
MRTGTHRGNAINRTDAVPKVARRRQAERSGAPRRRDLRRTPVLRIGNDGGKVQFRDIAGHRVGRLRRIDHRHRPAMDHQPQYCRSQERSVAPPGRRR